MHYSVRGPRFATGTVLASRYRIVTALGQGGMGEVYRADDLKLNQTVALKFLPPALASDTAALARLRQEVRVARQISHPNVCRVFDVGEIGDQSFLCMEFIDGEDLACLLRRIGRLPVDKALEIARQIAAGLAAIHDGGLLHRDLKPANVMIDGRGRAHITDFGTAIAAGEPSIGRWAGTPDYMAPEQGKRGEVSIKSDLYSLGLVIYEMLAGRPAWSAEGGPERAALPASVSEEIDQRIKSVLLRCLEVDPRWRPASALEVSAALTGQDPLALAVADGLTLSPEAVAAAPRAGSLRPAVALTLLFAALACLGAVIALAGRLQSFRQTPSEHSPDVLAERARSLLHGFGVSPPRDWASGFYFDRAYSRYLTTRSSDEMRRLLATGRPPLYVFWYRTSPGRLLASDFSVTPSDPPQSKAGETYVELDLAGRLHHLEILPVSSQSKEKTTAQPNWSALLAAAGFDTASIRAVPATQVPPVFADSRAAWEGSYPGGPSLPALPVRIEAAAFQGAPVWLNVSGPWSGDPVSRHEEIGARMHVSIVFGAMALLTAFFFARRNLRLGRGDLRGAFRLAVFAFLITILRWVIGSQHSLAQIEKSDLPLAISLKAGLFFWVLYVGFEPAVRRLWPERMISWKRLLAGRLRDPLVGRDVLVGCLLGLGKAFLLYAKELPRGLDYRLSVVGSLDGSLQGPARSLLDIVSRGLSLSLEFMLLLLALRILLRREGLAIAILWVALTWGMALTGSFTALNLACSGLGSALVIVAFVRFGPLAGSTAWVTYYLCLLYPLTLDTSVWYGESGLFAVLVVVSLALYGFATSVAGQPWLARSGVPGG